MEKHEVEDGLMYKRMISRVAVVTRELSRASKALVNKGNYYHQTDCRNEQGLLLTSDSVCHKFVNI